MILKIGAIVLILVLTYVGAGSTLLNNASALFFPRQLAVLLLTAAAAALVAAGLWRSRRSFLLAAAAVSATALVLHPSLQELRLQAVGRAIPISDAGPTADGAARCFCATRASLLEFFGAPDFIGDGDRGTARIYAYAQDRSNGSLVLYELNGRSGAEDRVIRIRGESSSPTSLGLVPW